MGLMVGHRDSILESSKLCILLVGCELLINMHPNRRRSFLGSFLSFLKGLEFDTMSIALLARCIIW